MTKYLFISLMCCIQLTAQNSDLTLGLEINQPIYTFSGELQSSSGNIFLKRSLLFVDKRFKNFSFGLSLGYEKVHGQEFKSLLEENYSNNVERSHIYKYKVGQYAPLHGVVSTRIKYHIDEGVYLFGSIAHYLRMPGSVSWTGEIYEECSYVGATEDRLESLTTDRYKVAVNVGFGFQIPLTNQLKLNFIPLLTIGPKMLEHFESNSEYRHVSSTLHMEKAVYGSLSLGLSYELSPRKLKKSFPLFGGKN